MSVERAAEEYFSQLNSIARRMYSDMKETKLAYDNLWDTISEKEQKQILSESIIPPEVLVQYKHTEIGADKIREYAVKLIIDDKCSYEDEHSGPFSFKTRSQRDLSFLERCKKTDAFEKPENKPKLKSKTTTEMYMGEDFSLLRYNNENIGSLLPKTGLDFLDNW